MATLKEKLDKLVLKFKDDNPPDDKTYKTLLSTLIKIDERAVNDAFNKIWNHKKFPSMYEIASLVDSEALKYKKVEVPAVNVGNCIDCENEGWFMAKNPLIKGNRGVVPVSCTCPKGLRLHSQGRTSFEQADKLGFTRRYKEWIYEQRNK